MGKKKNGENKKTKKSTWRFSDAQVLGAANMKGKGRKQEKKNEVIVG